jgi:hypothetical protein
MISVVDNFIKPHLQDRLERMFVSGDFPYYYGLESVKTDSDYTDTILTNTENCINTPQFSHLFVGGSYVSEEFKHITPISNKLIDIFDVDCYLTRCKVNLNTLDVRMEGKHHIPHIDMIQEDQITAIYYVNDSDGDTLFFDRSGEITQRVTPKKGTLVWWKGIKFHAKCSPVKTDHRIVINFNFLPFIPKPQN